MILSFHGAAQCVTGSKHLIRLENGKRILLDCGMFQGMGRETHQLNRHFGFDPRSIDYLFLSHAHIDHSGLIPRLVREGFNGRIFCTPPTFDLCEIMLADSAYIQEADIRFVNKRKAKQGKSLIEPLYTKEDVDKCLPLFHIVDYNEQFKVDDFVTVTFTDNGHILGSSSVNLRILEGSQTKYLTFTGDIGRYHSPLLRDPQEFPQANYIICESTYGNRLHDKIESAAQQLFEHIQYTCANKQGKLIIPAFSLGRTQEIVFALNNLNLHGLLPGIKIYVDSPLAVNATEVTRKHVECLNQNVKSFIEKRSDPFGFGALTYIKSKDESQELNERKEPCVIISASGMAEAGRVKHHIKHAISHKDNTILLVGYAEPHSLSGRLKSGDKEVIIFGEPYQVRADVKSIDALSAHGDYKEMIQFLSCQDPEKVEKVFLVHGEKEAQEYFKKKLKDAGFNHIFIPEMGEKTDSIKNYRKLNSIHYIETLSIYHLIL